MLACVETGSADALVGCPAISNAHGRAWPVGACFGSSRQRLPLGLLGEPVVEHGTREADMPAYSMARQAASPHGLVDPAHLDVEIPSGLLWAKELILRQCRR
jgi:hypothetical protein